ncbi:glycosyltransferase family 25 protein [Trichoderma ceciliae]
MRAPTCLSGIRIRLRLLAVVPLVIITYVLTFTAVDRLFFASNRIIIQTIPIEKTDAQTQTTVGNEDEPLGLKKSAQLDFGRVANKTLGFEKVIVIGLPERSDKRDAMELMASLSGFDIEWVDGVKPSSIPNKAVPFGIDPAAIRDNFLGSWRGHMNAIRQVVEQELGSALIIEDDMDWDIHLKSQLHDIAHGARQILHESLTLPHSPYGDDWDVLWLGHCGEPFPETLEENAGLPLDDLAQMSAKYIIHDDETVPPYSQVSKLVDWTQYRPQTRIVHLSAAPICTFAYAVSQRGAKKILYGLSVDGLHMAFDNSLAQLCRDAMFELGRKQSSGYKMKCLSVNPTIMFHHKAKGLVAAGSDIQNVGGDGSVREKGETESIKWSMRLNLKNILTGKELESQFLEDTTSEGAVRGS